MEREENEPIDPEMILDCSEQEEICFWARKFNVSPLAIKTAVRACCSNRILRIATYLQDHPMPGSKVARVEVLGVS